MLQGTKGTLFIDRAGYEITPQMTMRGSQIQTDRESYDDLLGAGLSSPPRRRQARLDLSAAYAARPQFPGLREVPPDASGRH
jgi:hypothetical protein